MLTLLILCFSAFAHWGNETSSWARDLREHLTIEERVDMLRGLVIDPGLLPPNRFEIHGEDVDPKFPWLSWRTGKDDELRTVHAALLESIFFTRNDTWDGDGVAELDVAWLDLRVNGKYRLIWPADLAERLRAEYVKTGRHETLKWFTRALKSIGPRDEAWPGDGVSLVHGLPELAFHADKKEHVMDAILISLVDTIGRGLDFQMRPAVDEFGAGLRAERIIQRALVIAKLLRQVRDTPILVKAYFTRGMPSSLWPLERRVRRPIYEFLDEVEDWLASDRSNARVVAARFVALANDVVDAIEQSGYLADEHPSCARELWAEKHKTSGG